MQPQGYGLDATFAALTDPTRRAILARLASGEASVMELAEPFAMAQPRPRRLEAKPLADATHWLESYRRFWKSSFGRLDGLLDELKTKEKKRRRAKRYGGNPR